MIAPASVGCKRVFGSRSCQIPLEPRVQPVALDYGAAFDAVLWLGDEPYGGNARRILSRPGKLPVTLRFLDPIDPIEAGDRKTLAAQAQAAVAASLAEGDPLYGPR